MSNDKIIAVVGVSDELTAHMRLLLRRAMPILGQNWKWGAEDIADLIVVDPRELAGQAARARAQASGVRCAVVVHEGENEDAAFILHVPFKLESFVEVMRGAARPSIRPTTNIEHADEDFYYRSTQESSSEESSGNEFWSRARARAEATAAEVASDQKQNRQKLDLNIAAGLDEVLKDNPDAQKIAPKPAVTLNEGVTIQAVLNTGRRAEARQGDSVRGMSGERFSDEDMLRFVKDDDDRGALGLREILTGTDVAAPSQLTQPGLPALTLDPKNQVVFLKGDLADAASYCQQPISLKALRVLTTRELTDIRQQETSFPYDDLRWLDQVLRGTGHLARKFDPAGTFRIKRPVNVSRNFRHHGRIADIMLGPGRRLNEIAQEAGSSMDDVFNMVNAYDLIGELEWQAKQRAPVQPEPDKSLLGKIKWPFGKKS
ncbi:hypothetical protein C7S18_22735 [Ahniella affigens]|uniref:Uncharacterized protein n=1 Tax=Ahniella affigens TaxID=2021234 RepID=A0A2P1PY86_9GAMM|nr:hypothetical protein [Ahniella affigens]AVP99817.1 hypothetical protein C7S18_22735 [Ahniella affigens]